jgi:hypothetical protein
MKEFVSLPVPRPMMFDERSDDWPDDIRRALAHDIGDTITLTDGRQVRVVGYWLHVCVWPDGPPSYSYPQYAVRVKGGRKDYALDLNRIARLSPER